MSLTNWLLIAVLVILVKQFYPTFADAAIVGGIVVAALYALYWMVACFPEQRRKQRSIREREEADETEYWEYRKKHDAIRDKYDPHHEWNEGTFSIPKEYLKEIQNLNIAHQAMLRRRNGWTDSDFTPMGDGAA